MSVSSHTDTHSTSASSVSSHATGVADSGRWSTRRIAVYALFVALSMAVSFIEFPLIPGVPWLKYDPSGIVSLVAGFASALPSLVIITVIAMFLTRFAEYPVVQNAFAGIRACVVVLIINAVVKLWKSAVVDWKALVIVFLPVFALSAFTSTSPILLVVAAAIAGIVITLVSDKLKMGGGAK